MQQPDSWSELASLIDTLLDAPPERRPGLIDDLSKGDSVRRLELERLLAECDEDGSLLDRPASDLFAAMFNEDVTQFPAPLVDRYRVIQDLGHGGMATVFHARDLKHGRDVAVKVVHPHLASALGADRFLHEIEIVSQLHHPHIVPLYDSGNSDGFLFFVMPYEPGLSLRQRLARHGPLAPAEVVGILRDVCDALSYAHERGIVHRDIKPDNVLIAGRHALVTDFGVAKVANHAAVSISGATRLPVGTPAYMAPEQIKANRGIDHRADIYAVGVLGYELLAGRPPFTGETRDEILAGHLTQVPRPLSEFRPDVPERLSGLIMKSLQKEPADRWQTADDLVKHLEALAIGATVSSPTTATRRNWIPLALALAAAGLLVVGATMMSRRGHEVVKPANTANVVTWPRRFSAARVERLTDFPGSEVDAAISANGQFVAFLADRHNVFDAFVTQLGSEQLLNLTVGRYPHLFHQNVRSIGFSSDGAHLWIRDGDLTSPNLSLLSMPGGRVRPFLSNAVMAVWSPDGSRIAYHEATPGDPIYVTEQARNPRRVFVGEPGIHNHYLTWSPDGRFIYFAHGVPPDQMDIWRVPSTGGKAERITAHNSTVGYPVLLDAHTLLYTAPADDGTGPWLYLLDLGSRVSRRVSSGADHYVSIAASDEMPLQGRRLVSTISNPRVESWSISIDSGVTDGADAKRLPLSTSKTLGAASVSPDGKTICFAVRGKAHSKLHCSGADGTGDQILASALDVTGAPSWSPDGKWITVAAAESAGVPHVYKVPVLSGPPVQLVDSVSTNPLWSPNGRFIVYCGPSREGSTPVRVVTPAGQPYSFPPIFVDRSGDSYRFLPRGNKLVVKLGRSGNQDFWVFDIPGGTRRRLTRLQPGRTIQHFNVSPDGKRIVFDRVWENSDIVLVELPRR